MVMTWKAPLGALVVTMALVGFATLTWALLPGKAEAQSCGNAGAPAVSDFEIKSWGWRESGGTVHVYGEILNNGQVAGRPQFEAILRDDSGVVVGGARGQGMTGAMVQPGDHALLDLAFRGQDFSAIEVRIVGVTP